MTIRVAQVGLGPIGAAALRQIVERPGLELGAAIDLDPDKIGRDAAEVCGLDRNRLGIVVEDELGEATAAACDIAVVCTSSSLSAFLPVAEDLVGRGLPIVSTTEELSYPFLANPEGARRLDAAAVAAGVAILGTGVNPGFAMDTLAMVLTAPCERVDRVTIERMQDAGRRRTPFQRKVGAGLEPARFRELVDQGKMGHVGFPESVAMIAATLGWELDRITDKTEPKIAESPLNCALGSIAVGDVSGIVQDGIGFSNGRSLIHLHMEAYIGAAESYDSVYVQGSPELRCRIEGGVPGDIATVSITVNSIPRVLAATPGLRTMRDLPPPSWWAGS